MSWTSTMRTSQPIVYSSNGPRSCGYFRTQGPRGRAGNSMPVLRIEAIQSAQANLKNTEQADSA